MGMIELIPLQFEPFACHEIDGGRIIIDPDTNYKTLVSLKLGSYFYLQKVVVTVFDPSVAYLVKWRLTINGTAIHPYVDRSLPGIVPWTTDVKLIIPSQTIITLDMMPEFSKFEASFYAMAMLSGFLLRHR